MKELAKRELARRKLSHFILYNFEDFKINWHHEILFNALEKVERGELKRLMVFMPPRHGKSEICSIQFPAWVVGKNKDKNIILASYSGDLATDFGRQTRNLIHAKEYQNIFNTTLAEDSTAKGKWNTNGRGAYNAVGVGGATTGKGADILIIDDPIKNRQDADSEVIRENAWSWYRSTARTRLSPEGAIILIMCMTGDTKVMMEDNTEKELKNICVGDKISTYNKGKLSVSTVKNWRNCGKDKIFIIKTVSGKTLKANRRHPFLTYNGKKLQWIRTKDLVTGQKIVIVKDNGVNGKVKNASGKNVKNQPNVEDIVIRTTIKKSGLMEVVRHLIIQNHVVRFVLKLVMALRWKNIIKFLKSKTVDVLFVENLRQEIISEPIGMENYVSTIATRQEKLEVFYVMIVIWRLVIQKLKKLRSRSPNISDFILDEIVSIKEGGTDDVYDIQVNETENFIANGVVSHNTRWHDDDLAGRILKNNPEDWEIISLPAIAEQDEEFRKKGEALWANHFTLDILEKTKKDLGSYEFSALYQQQPIDNESQEFKKEWFKQRDVEELRRLNTNNFLTIDTAISEKASADYTGICDNSIDRENFWNLKAWKIKLNPKDLIDLIFNLHEQRQYQKIGIEKTIYLMAIEPFLKEEMRKRNKFLPIVELQHNQTAKEIRIRGLVPRYQNGSIFHITNECKDLEEELLRFPKGVHDDVADAVAYQLQIAEQIKSIEYKQSQPLQGYYQDRDLSF